MAYVKTDSQNYTDIADAIRLKNGLTTKYLPSQMAAAIRAISGGGADDSIIEFNQVNSVAAAYLAASAVYDNASYTGCLPRRICLALLMFACLPFRWTATPRFTLSKE